MSMRTSSRLLLGLAALTMLAGGAFHGLAYPKALAMIDASSLSARGAAMYKGLWLNDAAVVMLIGLACLVLASKPALATRPMVGLLSALPLAGALSIYATVGNFLPGHVLLAAALMMAAAALAPPSHEGHRADRLHQPPGAAAHLNTGESAGSSSNRFIA